MQDYSHTITRDCIRCKKQKAEYSLFVCSVIPLYCETCRPHSTVKYNTNVCVECFSQTRDVKYGYHGDTPKYCYLCKKPNTINLTIPLCDICCTNNTFCGEEYCLECLKLFKVRTCIICNKFRAQYNYEQYKVPNYCNLCKRLNMVKMYLTVDKTSAKRSICYTTRNPRITT